MRIRLKDGTGFIDLKYVTEDVTRHGQVRIYIQRHGRKIRLEEEIGTDAFLAEYKAKLNNPPPPKKKGVRAKKGHTTSPGSLRWLIEGYYESGNFRRLGASTRRARRGILDDICAETDKNGVKAGDVAHGLFTPKQIRKLRDRKMDLPEAANGRVKALRQVWEWACGEDEGHATENPAAKVKYLKSKNPGGFHKWTIAEVHQYMARHPLGTKARLALDLLLFTIVRRSDVVKLGPQMEWNGRILFRETKGADHVVKEHEMTILPALRASIDATPSGHLSYLATQHGKPYTAKGFGNWFKRQCVAAGLSHCTPHGLRKAGATLAAEGGATTHELQALGGWRTLKEPQRYTEQANRKRLAQSGAQKLVLPEQEDNKTIPPSPVMTSGGIKTGKKA